MANTTMAAIANAVIAGPSQGSAQSPLTGRWRSQDRATPMAMRSTGAATTTRARSIRTAASRRPAGGLFTDTDWRSSAGEPARSRRRPPGQKAGLREVATSLHSAGSGGSPASAKKRSVLLTLHARTVGRHRTRPARPARLCGSAARAHGEPRDHLPSGLRADSGRSEIVDRGGAVLRELARVMARGGDTAVEGAWRGPHRRARDRLDRLAGGVGVVSDAPTSREASSHLGLGVANKAAPQPLVTAGLASGARCSAQRLKSGRGNRGGGRQPIDADGAGSPAGEASAKKSSVLLTLDGEPSAAPARGRPDRHLGAAPARVGPTFAAGVMERFVPRPRRLNHRCACRLGCSFPSPVADGVPAVSFVSATMREEERKIP